MRVGQAVDMAIDKDGTKSETESHIAIKPTNPASPPLILQTPLEGSNIGLFKTNSNIMVSDGYMYFQGTDQAVWRVSIAAAMFDNNNFGGPSKIKTKSNVFPANGYMYFRGTNDEVWQMSATQPYNPQNPNGFRTNSDITVSDGYMYFQGTDHAVWRVNVTNHADFENFGGPNTIKTNSNVYASGNYMYFQGTNNEVWQMNLKAPYHHTNLGGFKTNSDVFPFEDFIYFQGIDHAVWRVSIANPNTERWNFGGPNTIKTNSNVYASGNYMYFRGTDNKVWQMSMSVPYKRINVGGLESCTNIFPESSAIYFAGTDHKLWSYNFENGTLEQYAIAIVYALQEWYRWDQSIFSEDTGTWSTTGWWNSARALYALIDFMRHSGSLAIRTSFLDVVQYTFQERKGGNFLNNYYDDEGWWALTWINAHDFFTGDTQYLDMAKTIFNDMTGGWDTELCRGGMFWKKEPSAFKLMNGYKNAITNELFLAVAVKLYQHSTTVAESDIYSKWVRDVSTWFAKSGMINSANLINDGLTKGCANNGEPTWSYNQGVILSALCDMHDSGFTWNEEKPLNVAMSIANAVIAPTSPLNSGGILIEPGDPRAEDKIGADGPQFKGIFMQNLARLVSAVDQTQAVPYVEFIQNNTRSILEKNRNSINQLGYAWKGPFDTADAARQSSALETLNAAISVQ